MKLLLQLSLVLLFTAQLYGQDKFRLKYVSSNPAQNTEFKIQIKHSKSIKLIWSSFGTRDTVYDIQIPQKRFNKLIGLIEDNQFFGMKNSIFCEDCQTGQQVSLSVQNGDLKNEVTGIKSGEILAEFLAIEEELLRLIDVKNQPSN